MQEHGKVVQIFPVRTGVSRRSGESWSSVEFILEMDGSHTRRVKFLLWGTEQIAAARLQLGEYIDVFADVEAREYEGRWYNEIRVWDIKVNGYSRIRPNQVGSIEAAVKEAAQVAAQPQTPPPFPPAPNQPPY